MGKAPGSDESTYFDGASSSRRDVIGRSRQAGSQRGHGDVTAESRQGHGDAGGSC